VGLPEVARLEVEQHLRSDIKEAVKSLRTAHGCLLRLFGRMRELSVPTDDAIEAVIAKVFTELGVEVLGVPLWLSSAHSSFLKTIRKVPPSDRRRSSKTGYSGPTV